MVPFYTLSTKYGALGNFESNTVRCSTAHCWSEEVNTLASGDQNVNASRSLQ
jgi:hypothetical protein